jgi:hypothetical protein
VAPLALGILATALEEGNNLRAATLFHHSSGNRSASNSGGAHNGGFATNHEDSFKGNGIPGLCVEFFDSNDVVAGNLVLLPARLNHCEHRVSFVFGRISLNSLDKERSRTGFLTEFQAAFASISGLAAKKQRGIGFHHPRSWCSYGGKGRESQLIGVAKPHAPDVNTFAILSCHSLGMKKCKLPTPSDYHLFDIGAGRDFILNTAFQGKVWGDSKGGNGTEGQDIFWYFPSLSLPSVFLMDASAEDRLQMFGIPLTGGTNTFDGLFSADPSGSMAKDWLLPFVYYGYTGSGQLIVTNTLYSVMAGETVGRGQAPLKSSMIVEDFTFGGGFKPSSGSLQVPIKGDLGMTFRLLVASDVKGEFFILDRVFGQLVSWLNAVLETATSLDAGGTPHEALPSNGVMLDKRGNFTSSKAANDNYALKFRDAA